MPIWNEALQQWGYFYYESGDRFEWWGIPRERIMKYENGQNLDRINNNFTYHPPKGDQPQRYEMIREGAKTLALLINGCTPASREQSLALTALEEVVFQANAAIARNE